MRTFIKYSHSTYTNLNMRTVCFKAKRALRNEGEGTASVIWSSVELCGAWILGFLISRISVHHQLSSD